MKLLTLKRQEASIQSIELFIAISQYVEDTLKLVFTLCRRRSRGPVFSASASRINLYY